MAIFDLGANRVDQIWAISRLGETPTAAVAAVESDLTESDPFVTTLRKGLNPLAVDFAASCATELVFGV
jgi:hypothetical protein